MLIAGTQSDGVLMSNDKGATWHSRNIGLTAKFISALTVRGERLLAATTCESEIYTTGQCGSGFIVSTDGGGTWTSSNTGLQGVYPYNAFTFATSGEQIFVATQGGAFVSTDDGRSWDGTGGLPSNITLPTGVSSLSTNGCTLVASVVAIFSTSTDNGRTWHRANLNTYGYSTEKTIAHGSVYIGGIHVHGIYKSLDNGLNWIAANSDLTIDPYFFMRSVGFSEDRFLISTNQGVFASTDTGNSWNKSEIGLDGDAREIWTFQTIGNKLLAGTSAGVYASEDNGASWKALGTGLIHLPVRSLAADSTYLFAGTFGAGIWRIPLTDVGIKNEQQTPRMIAPAGGSYTGDTTATIVWHSLPGVDSYDLQVAEDMGFSQAVVFNGSIADTSQHITGLSMGGQYYWHVRGRSPESEWSPTLCFNISSATSSVNESRFLYTAPELTCSPNPTSGNFTVGFALPHRSAVHLTVNDVSGQEIEVLWSGEVDAGRYSILKKSLNLPSGMYFLQLKTSQSTVVQRLFIMH
jgi:photosystem II stability/assembly factor-like uncharacterized protein